MSKLRSLSTAFWSDPFIEDLTPIQKLLFIYLITNSKTNMLGVYESSVKKISFETGIKKEDVTNALKAFEKVGKVKYSNNYVILTNYMKHQNYNTNMKKSAIDVYNNLPKELKDSKLVIDKSNPSEGFETLLNHFGMVRKVEVEYETEYEFKIEEKVFSDEIKNFTHSILEYFPIKPKKIETWHKEIDLLTRVDKYDFNTILEIIKVFRADSFWSGNFQSLLKLRKVNKEDIKYIDFFNQQLNTKNNGHTERLQRTNEKPQNAADRKVFITDWDEAERLHNAKKNNS